MNLIKMIIALLMCVSFHGKSAIIYDYTLNDGTVLGSLGLSEDYASATEAWSPTNQPDLIEYFVWFDDNSGKTNFTGLFDLGVSIPREVVSLTGEYLDGARIQVDTNQYNIGVPGDWYSSLSYDIFENSVSRYDAQGNVEFWDYGTWWERGHRTATAVTEPSSTLLLFLSIALLFGFPRLTSYQ